MPELRPLSLGEILDLAIKLFTRHARVLLKIVLPIVLPIQILTVLVTLSTIPDAFDTTGFSPPQPDQPLIAPADIWTFVAGQLILLMISWFGIVFATGACFKAVADGYLGLPPSAAPSLRYALSHLRSLIWLSFLSTILMGVAALALIVPAIYLWGAWAVAVPVLLTEGSRGGTALNRSRALVKGRWWPTFGTMVIGSLLAAVVGTIIPAVLEALILSNVEDNLVASATVSGIAGVISGVITTPFQAAVIAIIYFDLRIRKEGFDLQLLASRIGSPLPPRSGPPPPPP